MRFTNLCGMFDPSMTLKNGEQEIYYKRGLIVLLPCVEGSRCVLTIWKLLEEVFLSSILRGGILSYYSFAKGDSIWLLFLLIGDSILSLCLREGEFNLS